MPLVVGKKIQIRKSIRDISKQLGIKEGELKERALLLYLESVKNILDVEKEFRAWDDLSDESLQMLSGHPSRRL